MDNDEGNTDCKSGKIAGTHLRISCSEHHENEYEGSDHLNEEGSAHPAGISHAIGAERCRITHCARSSGNADNQIENSGSDDSAQKLSGPISCRVLD